MRIEALQDLQKYCLSLGYNQYLPALFVLTSLNQLVVLQMMESREAGASGVLGVVACATGPELTPLLSSFAASIGLDCPVEVVNMQETDAMTTKGVPAYAVNISVGLTLSISGVSTDIAEGILQQLPFGAVSIVGARSTDEARKAREVRLVVILSIRFVSCSSRTLYFAAIHLLKRVLHVVMLKKC